MPKPDDNRVGKGRPPPHSRFKRGQSGNPSGRPKGAKNMRTLLHEALNTTVTIIERGRNKRLTKAQVMVARLINDAAMGKPHAIKLAFDLLKAYPLSDQPSPSRTITPDMTAKEAAEIYYALIREDVR